MKKWIFLLLLNVSLLATAQNLTLDQCQKEAEANYPLSKKRELIAKSESYTLSNISKAYLPQFSFNSQTTYQSDVVEFPGSIPGVDMPTQNKDQYKAYIQMDQVLLDGGNIRNQKETERAKRDLERKTLEVELYTLRERINQLYFGILVGDEKIRQNELTLEDIKIGLKTVNAQIANGTSFRSNADVLKAEELKVRQEQTKLRSNRKAYLQMLGLFVNRELSQDVILEKPTTPLAAFEINRPELSMYASHDKLLELGKKSITTENKPKVNLFVQAGAGNPALNFLEEGWNSYYYGGIKTIWSFGGLYTTKKKKQLIDLDKMTLEADKETFLFNIDQTVKQQNSDIEKYQQLLVSDDEIVKLRNNVKKASAAQLENGVITSSDYLKEVNNENESRQDKAVHEMELLLAQYNQKTTTGN
ncbi:TolC family protein [Flavobacterium sp. MAH-1]|uniref:TolC family protein n=1 Tax=Flavobacterium agri TaxID=2743471 RepID=A0A7Y8Y155_9FLAO|nr:TolC family protein [Flavobacterium agri]NUY80548.1 TolC family protein [Flavobacterium agri]NYA70572.1 TolC family protein [Flavobacterium agri]